ARGGLRAAPRLGEAGGAEDAAAAEGVDERVRAAPLEHRGDRRDVARRDGGADGEAVEEVVVAVLAGLLLVGEALARGVDEVEGAARLGDRARGVALREEGLDPSPARLDLEGGRAEGGGPLERLPVRGERVRGLPSRAAQRDVGGADRGKNG